jgi:hypothetical protein
VLVIDDLVNGGVVELVEEALLTVRYAQMYAHVFLYRVPYRVDIHRGAEHKDPLETSPIMPQE